MTHSDETLAWVTLTRAPAQGVPALSAALETLGGAAGLLRSPDALRARAGLGGRLREYLQSPAAEPTPFERDWLDDPRHQVIGLTDPRFPKPLREIPDCPVALYVDGDVDCLSEPQLAIVGSRNPSRAGLETAFAFARYLALHGLAITSGLAEGIDTEAHRGALAARGVTVAVLGSGVDVIYPPGNAALAGEVARSGALVSEFPLTTPARRGNFPQRNRIIAGLAQGTLVVEAARHSGSLITARLAGEQGREVFAIPGSIHNPLARGCHALIRQGAKLTETAHDILSELPFSTRAAAAAGPSRAPGRNEGLRPHIEPGMDKDHKILLDALGFDPTDLDTLVVRTGFKPEAVSSMVLILELEGHVQAASGGRYSRVARTGAGGER